MSTILRFLRISFRSVLIILTLQCSNNPLHSLNNVMLKADDSKLSDSLRTIYINDASRLVVRDMQNDSNWREVIEIPEDKVNMYYNGLVHIFNTRNINAVDSVLQIFTIHTFPDPVMNELVVLIDSSSSWALKWKNGKQLTRDPAVDSLMVKYNLKVKNCDLFVRQYYLADLVSSVNWNCRALALKFIQIHDVWYADPDAIGGGGNDITGEINNDYILFDYYLRWEDCPAGCGFEHVWSFKVRFNGHVEFIGSRGEPVSEYTDW